jgi:hypothetical protein
VAPHGGVRVPSLETQGHRHSERMQVLRSKSGPMGACHPRVGSGSTTREARRSLVAERRGVDSNVAVKLSRYRWCGFRKPRALGNPSLALRLSRGSTLESQARPGGPWQEFGLEVHANNSAREGASEREAKQVLAPSPISERGRSFGGIQKAPGTRKSDRFRDPWRGRGHWTTSFLDPRLAAWYRSCLCLGILVGPHRGTQPNRSVMGQ